ncbi:MAG: hypothetical protein V1855_00660 [bacterium]
MDTTIKCNNCDREMGLVEFSTYGEAYFIKLIAPAIASFVVAAIIQRLSTPTKGMIDVETRGVIDTNMAGLATNFSIACPNCGQINWYPASRPKPQKVEKKSKQAIV